MCDCVIKRHVESGLLMTCGQKERLEIVICKLHEVTRHFRSRSDLVKKLLKPLAVSSKAVATQKTS